MRRIRALTDRPFGANATLYFPGARENAQALLGERVPVINFSMAKALVRIAKSAPRGVNVFESDRIAEYAAERT